MKTGDMSKDASNPLSRGASITPTRFGLVREENTDDISAVEYCDDRAAPLPLQVEELPTRPNGMATIGKKIRTASVLFTNTKVPPEIDVFHAHQSLSSIFGASGDKAENITDQKTNDDENNPRRFVGEDDMTYECLFGSQEDRQPPSEFHFDVFTFEFFTQVFHPLLLPVVLWRQGRIAAENKGYIWVSSTAANRSQRLFLRNSFNSITAYLPIVMGLSMGAWWATAPLVIGECFVWFRYFVIAGKYASYRTRDYLTALSHPGRYANAKLLANAWMNVPPEVIEEELSEAQERFGQSLEDCAIKLLNGRYVGAEAYLRVLLKAKYGHPSPGWFDWLSNVMLLIYALFPTWILLNESNASHRTASDIALAISLGLQMGIYGPTIITFLWIGYLSYSRQRDCLIALFHAVVRSGGEPPQLAIELDSLSSVRIPGINEDLTDESVFRAIAPGTMFSLKNTNNVKVFFKLRCILRKFGHGYALRISFNTFMTVFVLGFLVLVLLQQAITMNIDFQLFAFVCLTFGVCSIIVLFSLLAASAVNTVDASIMELLAHEEHAVLDELITDQHDPGEAQSRCESSPAAVAAAGLRHEDVMLLKDLLGSMREAISQQKEVDPVRIMYLPARAELISAFIGVLFSGLLIALQIITSGGKNLN